MSKMRVYEYAKKFNLSSKEVIVKLKEMNIEVSNHMTTIEDDAVKKLDSIYQNKANNKPQSNQQQAIAKPQQSAPTQVQPNSQTNEAKQPEVRKKEAVKTAPKKPAQQAQSNQKGGFNNRNKGKSNLIIKIKTKIIKIKANINRYNHKSNNKKNFQQKSRLVNL